MPAFSLCYMSLLRDEPIPHLEIAMDYIGEKNSVARVRERTVPTERPLLDGEVSTSFCG
jgi:hypothetical protein